MPLDTSIVAVVPETVAGVRTAPNLASNTGVVFDYSITPIEAQLLRRSIDRGFAGATPALQTAIAQRHELSFELSGHGTAAGVPWWSPWLRGSMFATAVPNGSTDCGHPLATVGDGGSVSLDGWKDGERHRIFAARGEVGFNFTEKALPFGRLNLLGLPVGGAIVDGTAATGVTLPTYPQPVEVNQANTIITLDGFTLGVRSVQIDMGMKTTLYSTTGSRQIIFDKGEDGDRRAAGGTLVAELPGAAVKNFTSAVIAGTPLAFTLVHGTTAGNIIDIASAAFVPTGFSYSVENNRLFMNMPFSLVPTAAGNELTLKTR